MKRALALAVLVTVWPAVRLLAYLDDLVMVRDATEEYDR